jgi:hypothetical protein
MGNMASRRRLVAAISRPDSLSSVLDMETAPLLGTLCPRAETALSACGLDPALTAIGLIAGGGLICLLAVILVARGAAGGRRPDWRDDPWWDGRG